MSDRLFGRLIFGFLLFCLAIILVLTLIDRIVLSASFPLPDKFAGMKRIGCLCEQITEPGYKNQRWHTNVWVEYEDGSRWQRLYSIRDGPDIKKALDDCVKWRARLHKEVKQWSSKR